MTETPLDRAHARMRSAPDDDGLRLQFFERLSDAELFLLLEAEVEGDAITPQTFETGDETLVLVFDREERLADFVGTGAPYVGLSGRALAEMLAEAGLGFALNPEVAPSSFVLAAEGVAWLAQTLAQAPVEVAEDVRAFHPPEGLPEALLAALDQKLATAVGLAQAAYLARTETATGGRGHLLGFAAPLPGAEPALARAMGEALTFSGLEAGVLDIAFFGPDDPALEALARVGLRFDLPQPDLQEVRAAPGSDPAKPPILK